MSGQFSLAGRTVLITGALGGLGRAMARSVAEAGGRVVVHHLGQREEAETFAAELGTDQAPAVTTEFDITDWDAVEQAARELENETGGVDVLVNNAGYMTSASFMDMTLDQWRKTIDVDLTSVFICSRHLARGMLERGRGVIVNVSSQLAFKGAHDYTAYCAAKSGVVGLTRAMARELGPAIRVNAIAPGPVATPLTEPWDTPEWREERTRDLVSRRLGTPEEVGPMVAFLAGDAAGLLHGQTMHINGGGVLL